MASGLSTEITSEHIDDFWAPLNQVSKPKPLKCIARSSQKYSSGNLKRADATLNCDNTVSNTYTPPYKRNLQHSGNQLAYASYYQHEEDDLLTNMVSSLQLPDDDTESALKGEAFKGGLEDIEFSSMADTMLQMPGDEIPENANDVYNLYDMNHQYDTNLPIAASREDILNTIECNQVTVIEGPTGSGKTTQVPQYILDHYAAQNKYCNIVVTQPRRIAAMSIARRVCSERSWELRGICGYLIGMDKQSSEDTRLLYVTTQVLLRQLIKAKSMRQYTHIILDEVHERDQHSDFCLLVVRKLLRSNSRDVKVILMSATIKTDRFADYFKVPVRGVMEPAPILSIGATTYKVAEFFAEDLTQLGPVPELDADNPCISQEALDLAQRLIMEFDQLEIKHQGQSQSGYAARRGSVLVFLPGIREIMDMDEMLEKIKHRSQLEVLPLHSSITGDEQSRVFDAPISPKRKVILSTNLAESSITVADIKYVIDFCLTKNIICDQDMYTSLHMEWASKANCVQRKGRAGRVSSGRVYRMVTRKFYAKVLPPYGIPEMQRCSLEHLILQVKQLDLGEPKKILGLAISPPNLDDIERTILTLKEAGALTTPEGDLYNPHDGQLTFLGTVLAEMPVNIHFGKLMMLGHVFGVLEQCIIMAAMLSLKSVFSRPFRAELEAYKMKLSWSQNTCSDCIAMLKVYKLWEQKHQLKAFGTKRKENEWGYKHMVQVRRLADVSDLVKELRQRLANFNIKTPHGITHKFEANEETLILQVVMCGAFYPNYFIRDHNDESEELNHRILSGRNHYTTVMVKGLPVNEGPLYRNAIQQLFTPCHPNPRIHFEETKAFIEFPKDPTQKAKQFSPAVYLALKMRQLRIPLNVYLLDGDDAFQRKMQQMQFQEKQAADKNQLRTNRISMIGGSSNTMRATHQVDLPGYDQTAILLNITEVVECGRFWAHYADDDTWRNLLQLQQEINLYSGQNHVLLSNPTEDSYCLAPFEGEYYRARIVSVSPGNIQVRVFFLDYGNVAEVSAEMLRKMQPHQQQLKFQAFECELAEIRPSPIKCPAGSWTEAAKVELVNIVSSSTKSFGKVYSVVYGVVRIELHMEGPGHKMNVNKHLIDTGYADVAEEGFLSKQDHADRKDEQVSTVLASQQTSTNWLPVTADDSSANQPSVTRPRKKSSLSSQRLTLIGPNSPYNMTFSGQTTVSKLRIVQIDQDSINAIVLDDKPEDTHQRLLVAASMTLNSVSKKIKLRDTSLMPHIPGLPALLTLLFTPQAELRTDERQRRYTGALCGLGWDSFNQGPALPDHDMEIPFDVYIDKYDIVKINAVRIAINVAIGCGEDLLYWGPNAVIKTQNKAIDHLLKLLRRRRESMKPVYTRLANRWNQVKAEDLLPASIDDGTEVDQKHLYNLHPLVALIEEDTKSDFMPFENEGKMKRARMLQHIDYLQNKASEKAFGEPVECLLCKFKLPTPHHLKLHLATRLHKEEETRYLI